MIVLALETATRAGSLALARDGRITERPGDPARTHGERLPADLFALLEVHRIQIEAVDRLAVVTGPGSFTGLRVGLAAMQGVALARGQGIIPVPTLDAMVEAWQFGATPPEGLIAACLDGQRGEVFAGAFRLDAATGRRRAVLEPIVGSPERVAGVVGDAAGDDPITLVGLGVDRFAAIWDRMPRTTRVSPSGTLAGAAARLAADHPDTGVRPHALRPIYVRRPDAEIARERLRIAADADAWRVEPARPADLPAIEAIERQSFRRSWTSGALGRGAATDGAARLYVLRAATGDVVAYCACWIVDGELHINDLAVDERWRRRGLGTRLLRTMCREAAAGGARSATLEVRESNRAARALYEALGFTVEGVRRSYYDAPREDAVILWHRALSTLA